MTRASSRPRVALLSAVVTTRCSRTLRTERSVGATWRSDREASMKRLRILFLAAVLPFLCGSNLLAGAARTFVSTINGSDMNPCTHDLPCRSFAAAIPQTTLEGEVIALDSGGY